LKLARECLSWLVKEGADKEGGSSFFRSLDLTKLCYHLTLTVQSALVTDSECNDSMLKLLQTIDGTPRGMVCRDFVKVVMEHQGDEGGGGGEGGGEGEGEELYDPEKNDRHFLDYDSTEVRSAGGNWRTRCP